MDCVCYLVLLQFPFPCTYCQCSSACPSSPVSELWLSTLCTLLGCHVLLLFSLLLFVQFLPTTILSAFDEVGDLLFQLLIQGLLFWCSSITPLGLSHFAQVLTPRTYL